MRTNKQRLVALTREHFDNMRKDISARMEKQIGNDDWDKAKSIEVYERVLMNIYFSAIDWVSDYECKDIAWVIPDIIEKGLAVPVGSGYYGGKAPLPYRLRGNAYFEILYAGEWVAAQSIDWNLLDAVVKPKEPDSLLERMVRDEIQEKARGTLNKDMEAVK